MQIKGWQCHRRLKKRCLPRVESSPSVTTISDVRWATDATYVWTRFDGLIYVNAVLDCADRECIGLNVSQRNDAGEAAWALEDALIRRFGALPRGDADVALRTDNALVYASELYRDLAKAYGLHQEFILPHTPEQNGVAESFMGTLKLEARLYAPSCMAGTPIKVHRMKGFREALHYLNQDERIGSQGYISTAAAVTRERS
jgi:putative transposase